MKQPITLRYNSQNLTTALDIEGRPLSLNCLGTGEGYSIDEWKAVFFPQLVKKRNLGEGSECTIIFFGDDESYAVFEAEMQSYKNKNPDVLFMLERGVEKTEAEPENDAPVCGLIADNAEEPQNLEPEKIIEIKKIIYLLQLLCQNVEPGKSPVINNENQKKIKKEEKDPVTSDWYNINKGEKNVETSRKFEEIIQDMGLNPDFVTSDRYNIKKEEKDLVTSDRHSIAGAKNVIIVADSTIGMEVGKTLKNLIDKLEGYKAAVWGKQFFKDHELNITAKDKLVFIGKNDYSPQSLNSFYWKYSKLNMRYGWKEKIAILEVTNQKLIKDELEKFNKMCTAQKIKIEKLSKSDSWGGITPVLGTLAVAGGPLGIGIGAAIAIIKLIADSVESKNELLKAEYNFITTEFFVNDFFNFMKT